MDTGKRIQFLFSKYTEGTISRGEFEELVVWLYGLENKERDALSYSLSELWEKVNAATSPSAADNVNWEKMFDNIVYTQPAPVVYSIPQKKSPGIFWRVAAAVTLFCILSYAFWMLKDIKKSGIYVNGGTDRIGVTEPRHSNKAILTLADGSSVTLDSLAASTRIQQGGTEVIKKTDGQLVYKAGSSSETLYNTISTPRGTDYQVTLPDSTKVWLNAASSLHFPMLFSGPKRVVELTGEAYFEVSKNKNKPFVVKLLSGNTKQEGLEVEVLGTHFNIMGYEDEEAVKTTLLEGSVKVKYGNFKTLIKPGSQAYLDKKRENMSVLSTNTEMAVAWKNGYFYFDDADVRSIMRQVGRWYDLDIVYEGSVPDLSFSGKIQRSLSLNGILKLLKQGNINSRIESKKLVVYKSE